MRLSVVYGIAPLLVICALKSSGQSRYLLQDTAAIHRLDRYTHVFIDSSGDVSFNDIVTQQSLQARFRQNEGNLTFGYLKPNVWLKVETHALNPKRKWFLEIPAPYLEYVDFYQKTSDSTWQHSRSGYYVKQSQRNISHTNHIVPLHFMADSSSTLFIKIAGRSPKTFPIFIKEESRFNADVRLEDLGYGLFFGILVVMFFYNLLLYITLKQVNYLLYICTIVCTFLIFSAASGYGGKFLWPELPVMNFVAGRLSLAVMIVFLTTFTIRFLEVRKYSSGMYYVLLSLIPLAVISFFLVVTETMSSSGNNLISLSTVIYLMTGVVCRVKGNKTANYYIAAWAIYLTGGLLLTLRNSGFLDYNFWTTHFVEIGAALETTIIAFALGDRYRRYKQEKEEIQLLALKAQQDAREKLEAKVQERTQELSRANEELQTTLEKNRLQTQIIENKNAELDSFFYRISHDIKGPVSSILGLSNIAMKDVKDETARTYIEKQHAQTLRLNNIISGLIKLTKLNDSSIAREEINIHEVIEGCYRDLNHLPEHSRVELRTDIEPGVRLVSEWTLLNAIIQNLLENGIKYSASNDAYVAVKVWSNDQHVWIRVSDNGQGIPTEHQPKIFEMFYRATHRGTGSGLGLYILKRSVDKLNGEITLTSKPGVGSTFTIKLPKE